MKIEHALIPIYRAYDFSQPLPLLTKAQIKKNFPLNFQTDVIKEKLANKDVEWLSTSGTTSERMQIFRPKDWRKQHITQAYQYHQKLKALWQEPTMKRIVLTTAQCSQNVCFKTDQSMAQRWLDRSLYINLHHNPNHWQKKDIERMLDEMNQVQDYILDASPNYLAIFVKKLKQYGLSLSECKPKCITLGYELMNTNCRRFLSDFFECELINVYGSSELGYLLMDAEQGAMIQCSNHTDYEYIPLEHNDSLYELVVTTDKNPYMPLLRYRTGDVFELTDEKLSVAKRMMGRVSQLFEATQNQFFSYQQIDDCIANLSADIMLYQLDSINNKSCQLIYSTFSEQELSQASQNEVEKALSQFLGLSVQLTGQTEIEPQHSGKFGWLVG